jgi:hypothetical protein
MNAGRPPKSGATYTALMFGSLNGSFTSLTGGGHADNQRNQHHCEKAISGGGRNGVLLRNIELTQFRPQEIQ